MSVRPCLPWPDKRLRMQAETVTEITADHHAIWQDMIDTMEAMPGVGLAATQIGVMERLAVVDASADRGRAIRMANPEILEASRALRAHEEASPNLPGVYAKLTRPAEVLVRFMDPEGQIREQRFVDLWATSVQHQIDHLAGRMYFDHLSKVKRDMLLRKARKLATG